MKDFEKTLLNVLIYSYGLALSKCPPSLAEAMTRQIGGSIISYLKEIGIEFEKGDTIEDTVGKAINVFVEKGFVEDIVIDPSTERGMYCKWVKLVGIEAFHRLYEETGSAFISCPLSMVVQALIEPYGYMIRVNEVRFDLPKGVAESWEEFVKVRPSEEKAFLGFEAVDRYGKAEAAERLRTDVRKKAEFGLKDEWAAMAELHDLILKSESRIEELGKEIQSIRRDLERLKAACIPSSIKRPQAKNPLQCACPSCQNQGASPRSLRSTADKTTNRFQSHKGTQEAWSRNRPSSPCNGSKRSCACLHRA